MRLSTVLEFTTFLLSVAFSVGSGQFLSCLNGADRISLQLRDQEPVAAGTSRYHVRVRQESWIPTETAVIICDMWDSHHCVNAVRRVAEVGPRIDLLVRTMREKGVTIIHAPSGCMAHYKDHPSRQRAIRIPQAQSLPFEIEKWCYQIPKEEAASYPIDQSAGGEDDDLEDHRLWAERLAAIGRNPKAPWIKQCDTISIDGSLDLISDDGKEIWSILSHRGIRNVVLTGVHTNMCVLGRPFGLRRLASNGINVVLARDLTDTMYDPKAWPYVNHFSGTDLIIDHIERFVCPTISSDQVLQGKPFRFRGDQRMRLAMVIAEDEYKTEETLPRFADQQLRKDFAIDILHGSLNERSLVPGLNRVADADALLVSVRRRALQESDLQVIRDHVSKGKPVIGIRTASHAFSIKEEPPKGCAVWPEFDSEVFGGNYRGHYGNDLRPRMEVLSSAIMHPVLSNWKLGAFSTKGSLYKTAPLAAGSHILLEGMVEGEMKHPMAWTFIRSDGGRSFYTSLGHEGDFAQPEFVALLAKGIYWACGLTPPSMEDVQSNSSRYQSGSGKQRK